MWKPVRGLGEPWDGVYEVSDLGGIRRAVPGMGTRDGKILKTHVNPNGYSYVTLRAENRPRTVLVHRLVALAFLGEGHHVNHKNFDRTDNRLSNLEWVTRAENCRHARKNGRYSNHAAKLSMKEATAIRKSYSMGGVTMEALGEKYGVSKQLISKIVNYHTYSPKTYRPRGRK